MNARRHARKPRLEIDRIGLTAARRQAEHLSDRIDQQAVGFALVFDPDRHSLADLCGQRQSKSTAQVDRSHDATPQIEHAGDLGCGQRHAREPVEHENVLHPRDREAEQLAGDRRSDVFGYGFEHVGQTTSLTPHSSCRRSAP